VRRDGRTHRHNMEVIVERLTQHGFRFRTNDDEQTPVTPHIPPTRPPPSRRLVGAALRARATDAAVMGKAGRSIALSAGEDVARLAAGLLLAHVSLTRP
jgi:hypothetical protein